MTTLLTLSSSPLMKAQLAPSSMMQALQPLCRISGFAVALPQERLDNVDTDQIIPARFLKGTVKTGLGEKLFCDWRYLENGDPDPTFTLNQAWAQGANVLIARHNFGCGSSREHAPWALKDYGFQAVLAVSFADIFKNNALKNRVLPIVLPEATIQRLIDWLQEAPLVSNSDAPPQASAKTQGRLGVHIDLEHQRVTVDMGETARVTEPFEVSSFWKTCLLQGVDDIGYTLQFQDQILAYEQRIA
ncbi:MAG: 3-isopropylmalate dehydratase small subunit [Vampirovibrionales bacterium]|nr:3-isopropylmalate dehydratase small subunit [Vampirovibrionales bacterium]